MAKRIALPHCCGVLIDVQEFFLAQLDKRLRPKIKANTRHFVRLLGHFRVPVLATVERPLVYKGSLPKEIEKCLGDPPPILEKDFFDLTKERKIRDHLARLKRKQAIIAGCETDVCVLQSCLGLIDLGYEVFVVEDLLFSSARNVEAAVARMRAEGAVFVTYKTLFFELIEAVDGGRHAEKMFKAFGPMPDDIPESLA